MTGNRVQDSNPEILQLLFSGALAHLAQYLDTGCFRSAYLAGMVLEQVVRCSADGNLRREAAQLIEVLESKNDNAPVRTACSPTTPAQRNTFCAQARRIPA